MLEASTTAHARVACPVAGASFEELLGVGDVLDDMAAILRARTPYRHREKVPAASTPSP